MSKVGEVDRNTGVEYHKFRVTKTKIVNKNEQSPTFSKWVVKYKREPLFVIDGLFWLTDSQHSSYNEARRRVDTINKTKIIQTETWSRVEEFSLDRYDHGGRGLFAAFEQPDTNSTDQTPDTDLYLVDENEYSFLNGHEGERSANLTNDVLNTVKGINSEEEDINVPGFVNTWTKDDPHPSDYEISEEYVPISEKTPEQPPEDLEYDSEDGDSGTERPV